MDNRNKYTELKCNYENYGINQSLRHKSQKLKYV